MVHIADSVSVDAPGVSSILWLGRSVSSAYSIPQLMRTFMCMLLAFSAQDTRTVQLVTPTGTTSLLFVEIER